MPPLCASIILYTIERPKPVPFPTFLVVKKGSNNFSLISLLKPIPLSFMVIKRYSLLAVVEILMIPSLLSVS